MYPKYAASVEKDRARRVILASRLEGEPTRKAADLSALEIAGEDPSTLVILADQAIREHRTELARLALERLRRTGKRGRDLVRLEDALYGPMPSTSVEAVIRIERLLESGLHEKAALLAGRAALRWPGDPELEALLSASPGVVSKPPEGAA